VQVRELVEKCSPKLNFIPFQLESHKWTCKNKATKNDFCSSGKQVLRDRDGKFLTYFCITERNVTYSDAQSICKDNNMELFKGDETHEEALNRFFGVASRKKVFLLDDKNASTECSVLKVQYLDDTAEFVYQEADCGKKYPYFLCQFIVVVD
jgi:hypothetical protein